MDSEALGKIWEALNKVTEKQTEYEQNFLTNKSSLGQDTAENSLIAGDVSAQGNHLQNISDMIATIRATVEGLSARVNQNERAIDALEQYSRANCLILHGSQWPVPSTSNDQQVKNISCERHVIETLNSKLDLPTPITSSDIDISHPLPSTKNKNPIIIKFVRRTVRNMVFYHKKNLKGKKVSTQKLSITESLTKRRLRLVEAAREVFLFNNVWTMNGNVYCKFNGQKHLIDDFCDVRRIRFPHMD